MSFAVYYSRLEGLARNKIGTNEVGRVSTVEIAYALGVTIEDSLTIVANYSRIPNRQFVFEHQSRTSSGISQRDLIVRAVTADTRRVG